MASRKPYSPKKVEKTRATARLAISDYYGIRNSILFTPLENVHFTWQALATKILPRNVVEFVLQHLFSLLSPEKLKGFSFVDVYTGLGGMLYGMLDHSFVDLAIWYESDPRLQEMVDLTLKEYKWEEERQAYGGESKEFNGLPEKSLEEAKEENFVVYFDTLLSNESWTEPKVHEWLTQLRGSIVSFFRVPSGFSFTLKEEEKKDWILERLQLKDSEILFLISTIYERKLMTKTKEAQEKGKKEETRIENIQEKEEKEREEKEWKLKFYSFMDQFLARTIFPNPEERKLYLTEKAMIYWTKAFTHESYSLTDNYEDLEVLGDRMLEAVFSRYLWRRIPSIDKHSLTVLKSRYMSKDFQRQISQTNHFNNQIRIRDGTANIHIMEDVFESFFGALTEVSDSIQEGLGFVNDYKLIEKLFANVFIDTSLSVGKAISILDQLFKRLHWGKPLVQSERIETGGTNVTLYMTPESLYYLREKGIQGVPQEIGYGYGSTLKVAKQNAFEDMLTNLKKYGITKEWSEKEKEESTLSHPDLEPFMDRVNERLRKEGYDRMRFFVPKTLVGRDTFSVQLIGIRGKDDETAVSTVLTTAMASNLLEAKKIALQKYAEYKK